MQLFAYRQTMANARFKVAIEAPPNAEKIRAERRAREVQEAIFRARAVEKARRENRRREILERIEKTLKRYREDRVDRVQLSERIPIRQILRVLCDFHGVTVDDLMSRRRQRYLVKIRHEAIRAVADARPDMSLPELGRVFDGRDHTTIMHSLRQTAKPGFDYRGMPQNTGEGA